MNPKFKYSQVVNDGSDWDSQIIWLNGAIGIIGEDWDYHNLRFYFKTATDKTAYILKFS